MPLDQDSQNARPREPAGSNGQLRITYLQNPQIEKVLNGQTTGEGIKKTPAYETPLSKSDLDKWRKEFWGKLLYTKNIRRQCSQYYKTISITLFYFNCCILNFYLQRQEHQVHNRFGNC